MTFRHTQRKCSHDCGMAQTVSLKEISSQSWEDYVYVCQKCSGNSYSSLKMFTSQNGLEEELVLSLEGLEFVQKDE